MTQHNGRGGKFEEQPAPTPKEIRERCLEVQQEWSDEERSKRQCGLPGVRVKRAFRYLGLRIKGKR